MALWHSEYVKWKASANVPAAVELPSSLAGGKELIKETEGQCVTSNRLRHSPSPILLGHHLKLYLLSKTTFVHYAIPSLILP